MRKIRAVIFDRDNTLLHVEPTRLRALHEQLSALAPELSVAEVQLLWETWPGAWPRTVAEEPAFWRSFWTAAGQTHSLSPALVETFVETFGSRYATMFQAYPDAGPALRALRRAGLRLAILTNFELPSIDRTLAQAGLDPGLFELLLSRGTLGVAKPDPRAFMAVAEALRLRPEECCLVDDLSEHVVAARELGMHAFQIDRSGGGSPRPAGSVQSLGEVARACIQLNRSAVITNDGRAMMGDNERGDGSVLATLFAHNIWANLKVLEFCEQLSDAQLDTTAIGGYGSIRDTLQHIISAEVGYVERVSGKLPATPLPREQFAGFGLLKGAARWAGDELLQLALSAREETLVRQRPPRPSYQYRLASLIVQALTHSTEHRTQISAIITQLGMEPPDMSGWRYMEDIGELQEFGAEAG